MATSLLGSGEVIRTALVGPDASSAEGLTVARWADRPARLGRMDRLCAIALVACDAALVDADLSPGAPEWIPERTGIVLGTAFGCHATNEAYYRGYLDTGVAGASPRLFAYTLPSSPVGEISIQHRILGPASTAVAGLSAAIDALSEAMRHLDADRADRMLVAAADVGTPLLARMGLPSAQDSAAALLLGRVGTARAQIVATVGRFVANDPDRAAQSVLAAIRDLGQPPRRIYGPASLRAMLASLGEFRALDERALAAAPLLAIRDALCAGAGTTLIVALDPVGQAGAALLRVDERRV